jgi:hypothetical protein
MHLIQILLPLYDPQGELVPRPRFETLARLLTDRFGGVTSYTGAPAEGRWKAGEVTERDTVVMLEVMTDSIDGTWWRQLREQLQNDSGRRTL